MLILIIIKYAESKINPDLALARTWSDPKNIFFLINIDINCNKIIREPKKILISIWLGPDLIRKLIASQWLFKSCLIVCIYPGMRQACQHVTALIRPKSEYTLQDHSFTRAKTGFTFRLGSKRSTTKTLDQIKITN